MTDRPYRPYLTAEIMERAEMAYDGGDVLSLESALQELTVHRTHRPDSEAVIEIKQMIADLQQQEAATWKLELDGPRPPDEWLDRVAKIASGFAATETGDHRVYLALLWGMDGEDGFGVYVGQTGLTAKQRYRRHKRGEQAGKKWVTRFGIGLLTPMFDHLHGMSWAESKRIEKALAASLSEADFFVRGGH